jgi:hypothetical protein
MSAIGVLPFAMVSGLFAGEFKGHLFTIADNDIADTARGWHRLAPASRAMESLAFAEFSALLGAPAPVRGR